MVIGGTGLVGGYIVERLLREGQRPIVMTRSHRHTPGVDWSLGDMEKPDSLKFPAFATLFCTADAILLANALPRLFHPAPEALDRLQFDQRDYKTGHGSRSRARDGQEAQ